MGKDEPYEKEISYGFYIRSGRINQRFIDMGKLVGGILAGLLAAGAAAAAGVAVAKKASKRTATVRATPESGSFDFDDDIEDDIDDEDVDDEVDEEDDVFDDEEFEEETLKQTSTSNKGLIASVSVKRSHRKYLTTDDFIDLFNLLGAYKHRAKKLCRLYEKFNLKFPGELDGFKDFQFDSYIKPIKRIYKKLDETIYEDNDKLKKKQLVKVARIFEDLNEIIAELSEKQLSSYIKLLRSKNIKIDKFNDKLYDFKDYIQDIADEVERITNL